jgi:hypothetical protein
MTQRIMSTKWRRGLSPVAHTFKGSEETAHQGKFVVFIRDNRYKGGIDKIYFYLSLAGRERKLMGFIPFMNHVEPYDQHRMHCKPTFSEPDGLLFFNQYMEMTMLQSYEAIYEHGAITWLGEKPSVSQAHVIVTILDVSDSATTPLQKTRQPSPLIAGKGSILADLTAPASPADEWNCLS